MALLILVWWVFTTPTNGKGGLGERIFKILIISIESMILNFRHIIA